MMYLLKDALEISVWNIEIGNTLFNDDIIYQRVPQSVSQEPKVAIGPKESVFYLYC